jgi:beta-glucosidase-like glycosyl hydrolase
MAEVINQVIENDEDDDKLLEPTLRHYEWFEQWALKGRSQRAIALEAGVSQVAVCKGCRRVYLWRRKAKAAEIEEMSERHLATLEALNEGNLEQWYNSKDTKYSAEARAAMDDARRILGVEAPKKTELSGSVMTGGLIPITASSRRETIKQQLQATLERMTRMDAGNGGAIG